MNDHYLYYQSRNSDTNHTQIINQNNENQFNTSLNTKDQKNLKEKQINTNKTKINSRNNNLNMSQTQTIPIKQNKLKE